MVADTHRYATINDLLEMEGRLRRDLGRDIRNVGADIRALEKRMDERLTAVLAELKRDRRAPATIPDLSELDDNSQTVYKKLVEVARNRTTITYGTVGRLIRRPPNDLGVLDPIFWFEHKASRPLIGALIVAAPNKMPSKGFFDTARAAEMDVGDDEQTFWERCRDEVYDYWAD